MAKQSWKGSTLLAPVPPVMVACGTVDKPNIITVAWTGIINSEPAMTYISVRPVRYSYDIIKNLGEFTINLTTKDLCRACDICGVKSGRDVNKFELTGLHAVPAFNISAPIIEESPLSLECVVRSVTKLGTHDMFIAEIVSVAVDEELLDQKGKFHLDKCGLVAYSHGEYFELGKKLGSFGFSVRKNKKQKRK